MGLLGSIWVKLGLDNSNFKKGLNESQQSTSKFKSFLGGMASGIAAAFSVAAITNFAKKSVQAYNESVAALTKLNSVIRATGNASGISSDEMVSFASDLQKVTKFEDDATVNAMALLSAFKSIKGDIFKGAVTAAQDLATVMGTDLNSAIMQVGKALEIPEVGLTMLRRSGVTFSEEQTAAVKKLLDEGKKYEAQLLILTALNEKFGGAAKDAGDTAQGSWTKAWNALDDLMETLGSATEKTIGFVGSLQGWFEDLNILFTSKNLTFWQKFTAAIGGNRKAFAEAQEEAKAYAESQKQIAEQVKARMETIKSVADAERNLKAIQNDKSLVSREFRKALQDYIQAQKTAEDEGDTIANGIIPQLEKEIEKKNELLKFAKDESSVRQLNDEISRLQKKLDLLKMTTKEAEAYNSARTPLPAAPATPAAISNAGVNTQNALDKDIQANQEYYNNLKAQREGAIDDLEADQERVADIGQMFNDTITESISGGIQALTESLIETGKIDTSSVLQALLTPFGDMAIQLGEYALAAGIGIEAIKTSFDTMNGAVAIAAGVALIALGSAIKYGVASLGKSGGTGASPYNTSYSGGALAATTPRSIRVEVVGKLEGSDIRIAGTNSQINQNR